MIQRLLIFCLIITTTTACQYCLGPNSFASQYPSISVPYVEGDDDGDLTAAIIEQLSTTSGMKYCKYGGSLVLNVEVLAEDEEHIGFRFDKDDETGLLTDNLIPAETRTKALVQIELIEACSGKVVLGPTKVIAHTDYDHDYDKAGLNVFSLGQVNDYESTKDISYRPLNSALARKIVDRVVNNW